MENNNQLLDEMFESMLEEALTETSLRRSETFPSLETVTQITHMSKRCDRRGRRTMNWFNYEEKLSGVYRLGKRYAVIAAVTISITLGALLLSSQEVRASIIDVIIEIYEQFMEFKNEKISNHSMEEFKLEPEYIPQGYDLTDEDETSLFIKKTYENEEGKSIDIWAYLGISYIDQIDNESYIISPCTINGYSGHVFINKEGSRNIINWFTGDIGMYIEADLSKKELIKVAKKIK